MTINRSARRTRGQAKQTNTQSLAPVDINQSAIAKEASQVSNEALGQFAQNALADIEEKRNQRNTAIEMFSDYAADLEDPDSMMLEYQHRKTEKVAQRLGKQPQTTTVDFVSQIKLPAHPLAFLSGTKYDRSTPQLASSSESVKSSQSSSSDSVLSGELTE